MKLLKSWGIAATILVLSCAAQATPLALVDEGNGTVYDPNTQLSWLKNWDSLDMNWENSKIWAAGLTVGGAMAGQWRLPEIGEYRQLFSEYGALTSSNLPFKGVFSDYYWSGTEVLDRDHEAWQFETYEGRSHQNPVSTELYAVAVRAGDVATSVPEPQTLALVLLALSATVMVRRRRPR